MTSTKNAIAIKATLKYKIICIVHLRLNPINMYYPSSIDINLDNYLILLPDNCPLFLPFLIKNSALVNIEVLFLNFRMQSVTIRVYLLICVGGVNNERFSYWETGKKSNQLLRAASEGRKGIN
jgi:hypothetical protein